MSKVTDSDRYDQATGGWQLARRGASHVANGIFYAVCSSNRACQRCEKSGRPWRAGPGCRWSARECVQNVQSLRNPISLAHPELFRCDVDALRPLVAIVNLVHLLDVIEPADDIRCTERLARLDLP